VLRGTTQAEVDNGDLLSDAFCVVQNGSKTVLWSEREVGGRWRKVGMLLGGIRVGGGVDRHDSQNGRKDGYCVHL
jgi:hypothetical protein